MISDALKLVKSELNLIRRNLSRDTATQVLANYLTEKTPSEFKFKVTAQRGGLDEIMSRSGGVVGAKTYGTAIFIELFKNTGEVLSQLSDDGFNRWFTIFLRKIELAISRASPLRTEPKTRDIDLAFDSTAINRGYKDKPVSDSSILARVKADSQTMKILKSRISTQMPVPSLERVIDHISKILKSDEAVIIPMGLYMQHFSAMEDVYPTFGIIIASKARLEATFPNWKFFYKPTLTKGLLDLDLSQTSEINTPKPSRAGAVADRHARLGVSDTQDWAKRYIGAIEDELLALGADDAKVSALLSDDSILDEIRRTLRIRGTTKVKIIASELYSQYIQRKSRRPD